MSDFLDHKAHKECTKNTKGFLCGLRASIVFFVTHYLLDLNTIKPHASYKNIPPHFYPVQFCI